MFALLNPYALLNLDEARDQITASPRQADTAKLGQDDVYGWLYYLGTLTWGFGWLPLARRGRRRRAGAPARLAARAAAVAFPRLLLPLHGRQGRFFGRWLLPIYPALCVLAGYARPLATRHRAAAPRRRAARRPDRAGSARRALLATVHVDRLLGREDTRAQALAGSTRTCRPARRSSWSRSCRTRGATRSTALWPVERPYQAYEKRLRVRHIERYRERGHCWVIVGSSRSSAGWRPGLRSSRNYYRALDAASAETVTFSPFARGADPVGFSYDSLVQLPAARIRAPRPRRRDPPAARLHPRRAD